MERRRLLATFTVANTEDAGAGSLRQAFLDANATAGLDTIVFAIPGSGPHTISPLTALPSISESVVLDATSQTGYAGTPLIEIDGQNAINSGLVVSGVGVAAEISGLAVTRFTQTGITIALGASGNVHDNYIGIRPDGVTSAGNGVAGPAVQAGVFLQSGSLALTNNVISGNNGADAGVYLAGTATVTVRGNRIGTDASGLLAVGNVHGIYVDTASSVVIGGNGPWDGNVISGNTIGVYAGVFSNQTIVMGNLIGLNATGDASIPNNIGVSIEGETAQIGTDGDGTNDTFERNVISGNASHGVLVSGSNALGTVIAGNYIGTDISGSTTLGNGYGIELTLGASGTIIGGHNVAQRNVISGNTLDGVRIGGASTTGNTVIGNYIGVSADGLLDRGNNAGIRIAGAPFNRIGDGAMGGRNVIAGNAADILINGATATGNRIHNNLISIDASGNTVIVPSFGYGILISGGVQGTIIGTDSDGIDDASEGNVIAMGGTAAISLQDTGGAPVGTVIAGNRIGVGPADNLLSVGSRGIWIRGANGTRIGTDADGNSDEAERNLIVPKALSSYGILVTSGLVDSTAGTSIAGNFVGLDSTGTRGLSNTPTTGIAIISSDLPISGTTIGGSAEASRNVVGSVGLGIQLSGSSVTDTNISGNFIGTDVTGTRAIGNSFGVELAGGTSANAIGGILPGQGNRIANNQVGVIVLGSSNGNAIRGNEIENHTLLGIDLNNDGVTSNDATDEDSGPNLRQNYPVLDTVSSAGTTTVSGSLSSTPSTSFTLDFYASSAPDSSGFGEGARYLGASSVTTNASGTALFAAGLLQSVFRGEYVTATATDPNGNTSEFSAALLATFSTPPTIVPGSLIVTVISDDEEGATYGIPTIDLEEGQPFQLTGAFADADASVAVSIQWGDGQSTPADVIRNESFSAAHVYDDDNPTATPIDSYDILVRVVDADGSGSAVINVNVHNVDPVLRDDQTFLSSSVIDEGQSTTLAGTFEDPGLTDFHRLVVDWGDGSPTQTLQLTRGERSFAATHPYRNDGNFTIRYSLFDDDRDPTLPQPGDPDFQFDASASIVVRKTAPTATIVVPSSVVEGDTVPINAVVSDGGGDSLHYEWLIVANGEEVFSSKQPAFQFVPDQTSVHEVHLLISDGSLATVATASFTVNNALPTIRPDDVTITAEGTAVSSVMEGATISLSGGFSDASPSDIHLVTVDFGDGSPAQSYFAEADWRALPRFVHTYLDDPDTPDDTYEITISVDDGSDISTVTILFQVLNANPVVSIRNTGITATDLDFDAVVTDSGALDQHDYEWYVNGTLASTTAQLRTNRPSSATADVMLRVRDKKASETLDGGVAEASWLLIVPPNIDDPNTVTITSEASGDVTIQFDGQPPTFRPQPSQVYLLTGDQNDTIVVTTAAGATPIDVVVDTGSGDDTVTTAEGNDVVIGGSGSDSIQTGAGNDTLIGNGGDDTLNGGSGDDDYRFDKFSDKILIDESGIDTLNFEAVSEGQGMFNGITLDLGSVNTQQTVYTSTTSTGTITLDGAFENVVGSQYDDNLSGNDEANKLFGGPGDDSLSSSGGNDTVGGGDGDDTINGSLGQNDSIFGGPGDDSISSGGGSDSIDGGDGNDTIDGSLGQDDSIFGGPGDDSITGGVGNESIIGGDGNDTIHGGGDSGDSIFGGPGDDSIAGGGGIVLGGDGNDSISGGNGGNDSLIGGIGNDTIVGGSGSNDSVFGGPGDDSLGGIGNPDVIDGGDGDDTIIAGDSDDSIFGGPGDDSISAGNGADTIDGGVGDDVIIGGNSGGDSISGGPGDDSMISGGGNETLDGGSGNDTILAANTSGDSIFGGPGDDSILGGNGDIIDGGSGDDSILGGGDDESIVGGLGDDTISSTNGSGDSIFGGPGDDSLLGGGRDTIDGGEGDDTIIGGIGNDDSIFGGPGDDSLSGGGGDGSAIGGDDTIDGGDGNDTIVGGIGSDDSIFGGPGDDSLVGGGGGSGHSSPLNGADTIDGGEGDDTIVGGADTEDSIFGGPGDDSIAGGGGRDSVDGGDGDDTILGGSDDSIFGGPGDDSITGAGDHDTLAGGDGNDTIVGGNGNQESIDGGAGDDTLIGGGGSNDSIFGGPGDDSIVGSSGGIAGGGSGQDTISGGDGDDTITGGDASDDSIFGGPGDDSIRGGAGDGNPSDGTDDTIDGGEGNDTIIGGDSDDSIFGGPGDDSIASGGGADTIVGGDGNDSISGGADDDESIDGGSGDDTLSSGGGSNDSIFGGSGNDLIILDGLSTKVDGGQQASGDPPATDRVLFNRDADIRVMQGALPNLASVGFNGIEVAQLTDVRVVTIVGGPSGNRLDARGFLGDVALMGLGGDDTLLGGLGNDTLEGGAGNDMLDGDRGNDAYLFAGREDLGMDTLTESIDGGTDELDFFGLGWGVDLDLALGLPQQVAPGLSLTLTEPGAIENVVGTVFPDKLLGNAADNLLVGGGGADYLYGAAGNDKLTATRTRVVYLDFETETDTGDHLYSPSERDAIVARMRADFGAFDVEFYLDRAELPNVPVITVLFNSKPIIGGRAVSGGVADRIGFRDLVRGGTVRVDVNDFLGNSPNRLPPTEQNYVALSSTIASHELGHLFGVRHHDAMGAPGEGIFASLADNAFLPSYAGPANAIETSDHLISSPASVRTTLSDALANPYFGEREALKLAFGESGSTIDEDNSVKVPHPNFAFPIQQLGPLVDVAVPNTIENPLAANYGVSFDIGALNVRGSIELAGATSENDLYSFEANAGDVITIEILSFALRTRFANTIDSLVRVFDGNGRILDYYNETAQGVIRNPLGAFNDDGFEPTDSILWDLRIPADGTYFVEVDTFNFFIDEFPQYVPGFDASAFCSVRVADIRCDDTDTGDYELLIYRIAPGTTEAAGDILIGGEGSDTLISSSGYDTFLSDANDTLAGPGPAESITLNRPPTLDAIPPQAVVLGTELQFRATGADPDELDVIRYRLAATASGEFPSGATIDPLSGVFRWLPTSTGVFAMEIIVTDLSGQSASRQATITVTQGPEPVIVSLTGPSVAVAGQRLTYAVATQDPSDILSWQVTSASGAILAIGSGTTFDYVPSESGAQTVTVTANSPFASTSRSVDLMVDRIGVVDGDLYIAGDNGNDILHVYQGSGNTFYVYDGQQLLGTYTNVTGQIIVNGFGGDDVIYISDAIQLATQLYGGAGNDWIVGGSGRDTVDGGSGSDWINGRNGDDYLLGADANDIIFGGNGADWIDGGAGDDWLFGDAGDDTILGGAGDDAIFGGKGQDLLEGMEGNDLVFQDGLGSLFTGLIQDLLSQNRSWWT